MSSNEETEQEIQEREHFQWIVNVFKSYKAMTNDSLNRKLGFVKSFPKDQQKLLRSYTDHLEKLRECVAHNADIIQLIIQDVECMFENIQHGDKDCNKKKPVLPSDLSKVHSTLRQLVRDWSSIGAEERKLCYDPILDAISRKFPKDKHPSGSVSVLVPGAGLGRLSYELASRGYVCQGNEFSLFMLFASNFVLNRACGTDSLKVYPWIQSTCNVQSAEHQTEAAPFPDVNPSDLPPNSKLTMAAGDFLEIYTEADSWDCVATCFFIDCASNIVNFIQTIYNILKPGCHWINLGPLLYHYADMDEEQSIEPSYDQLIEIIKNVGFNITEQKTDVRTTYTQNPMSMLKYDYMSVFFIATKPS